MCRVCGSCAHFARVRLTRVCVFDKLLVPCAVLVCARFDSCALLVRVRLGRVRVLGRTIFFIHVRLVRVCVVTVVRARF